MSGFTSGKVQHNDPKPMVNYGDDGVPNAYSRHARYSDCSAQCVYAPRSEFDHHNSMLEDFQRVVSSDLALDSADLAAYWLKHWETVTYLESPEHIAHARRVLTKLAALA